MKIEIPDIVIEFVKQHFVGEVEGCGTINDAINRLLVDGIGESTVYEYEEFNELLKNIPT